MRNRFLFACTTILLCGPHSNAAIMIYPGSMYLNTSVVSHGQEFAAARWAIDGTGNIQSTTIGSNTVTFDYSARTTPYGNWSVGGPAQGTNNIFNFPFTAGNLTNVVDVLGNHVTLVDGEVYQLNYMIKPSEFSFGTGLGTWAIGNGNTYSVSWNYNGNLGSSSVIADVTQWKTVSFEFTYQAGNDFIFIGQSLNGGAPTVTRLSGSGGPTPGANLDAPTIQFAGASPVPEPSSLLIACTGIGLLFKRRRNS